MKPPLDRLKAVVKDWPESFKMKDELVRVLEQMLSFQPSDRPTAEQLLLLPLLSRFEPETSKLIPFACKTSYSHGAHLAQPSPRLQVAFYFIFVNVFPGLCCNLLQCSQCRNCLRF